MCSSICEIYLEHNFVLVTPVESKCKSPLYHWVPAPVLCDHSLEVHYYIIEDL